LYDDEPRSRLRKLFAPFNRNRDATARHLADFAMNDAALAVTDHDEFTDGQSSYVSSVLALGTVNDDRICVQLLGRNKEQRRCHNRTLTAHPDCAGFSD
jgi:aspartyl/asparaginyl-tRNA synthetase